MLAGIIGAIVGWLLGFFGQAYFSLRSQDVAQINDFLADLDRIERLSIEYWLNGQKDAFESQAKVAAQLRGALHASSMFLAACEKLLANDLAKFQALDGQLFDAATGGEFETAKQAPDHARVVEIMVCTNEIRSLLRVARRKTYWAR